MWLTIFLSLVCCSLAFETCISANKQNMLQVPYKIEANPGENAVINCTVREYATKGVHMRKRFKTIFSITTKMRSVDQDYKDRLSYSGDSSHFSVTLKNLTVNDSDIYLCDTVTVEFYEICAHGTLLIVHPLVGKVLHEDKNTTKEETNKTCIKNTFDPIPYIITISAMLVLCVAVFIYMKLKKSKEKQNFNHNTYVDMTQTLRRNTMGNSFIYNRTENGAVLI